jgi:hypothetical protein
MDALSEPVPRPVFDHVVRSPHVERLFEVLEARHLVRNTCRPGHPPVYPETDEQVTPLLRKLTSLGLKADNEDKLLVGQGRVVIKFAYFELVCCRLNVLSFFRG